MADAAQTCGVAIASAGRAPALCSPWRRSNSQNEIRRRIVHHIVNVAADPVALVAPHFLRALFAVAVALALPFLAGLDLVTLVPQVPLVPAMLKVCGPDEMMSMARCNRLALSQNSDRSTPRHASRSRASSSSRFCVAWSSRSASRCSSLSRSSSRRNSLLVGGPRVPIVELTREHSRSSDKLWGGCGARDQEAGGTNRGIACRPGADKDPLDIDKKQKQCISL